MTMKTIFLFALLTCLLSAKPSTHDPYYNGFIERLGLEIRGPSSDKDCHDLVASIVDSFKNTLVIHSRDVEALLLSVVDIVDKLKFEVSPECKTYFGDFEGFMSQYSGEIDELRELALQNLDQLSFEIDNALIEASQNLDSGADDLAGNLHAHALRYFIGLEKIAGVSSNEIEDNPREIPIHIGDIIAENDDEHAEIDQAVDSQAGIPINENRNKLTYDSTEKYVDDIDGTDPEAFGSWVSSDLEDFYEDSAHQITVTLNSNITHEQIPVRSYDAEIGDYVDFFDEQEQDGYQESEITKRILTQMSHGLEKHYGTTDDFCSRNEANGCIY